jgi:hypothetical protein
MYDEVHYRDGVGPAKRQQVAHRAVPADLATLIAAAIPDPAEQERAGLAPPPEEPVWPWPGHGLSARVREAEAALAWRTGAVRGSSTTA